MTPLTPRRTALVLGAMAAMTGTAALGGGMAGIGDRCAAYGAAFVELENGTCGLRHPEAGRGGASNAGLRSDGLGMLPGAGNARHLRIQADPYLR